MQLSSKFKKPIAITAGEPSSIAAEILFKAWLELKKKKNLSFFTISNLSYLNQIKRMLGYSNIPIEEISSPKEASLVFNNALPIINIPFDFGKKIILGAPNFHHVPFVIKSLDLATDYAKKQELNAIVTLPIEKYIMQKGSFKFIGHTEYLAYKNNVPKSVMLMASPFNNLKVVPIKTHLSLKESISNLTQQDIIKTIEILNSDLQNYLKKQPTIAVLGLNPHAGEQGLMGQEEITTIQPAIEILKKQGILIAGPLPPDTSFNKDILNKFDVIVGMYHDQVLTPFKALLFEEGVNVTLGLSYLRTSPDHGTALDIANKNIANPKSLIAAILLANLWQK